MKIRRPAVNLKILFLVLLSVWMILHHFIGFSGHYGWDDMEYASLANQLNEGTFNHSINHFAYRWAPVMFTALSYKIFGINDFASALPALLVTLCTLWLVFYLVRRQPVFVVMVALSLFALNHWTLFYSDKLMTDSYVALGFIGAIAAIYRARFETPGKQHIINALLFSGFLLFAFISKETIVLTLPVFLLLFLSDVIHKRVIRFWMWTLSVGLVVIGAYFFLVYLKTGSPWSRFTSIGSNSYLNPCRYDLLPVSETISRVGWQLWAEFIRQFMIIGVIFLIPAIICSRWRELLRIPGPSSFFVAAAIAALLSANFMTTSYVDYVPMCLDPRHYLFLTPLLAVAAGWPAVRFFQMREGRFLVPGLLLLFIMVSLVNHMNDALYTYLPLFALSLFRSFIPDILPLYVRRILVGLFIGTLLIQPVNYLFYSHSLRFDEIREVVQSQFGKGSGLDVVLTDPVQKRIGEYYLQFDTSKVKFLDYTKVEDYRFSGDETTWLMINHYTTFLSEISSRSLPYFMFHYVGDTTYLSDKILILKTGKAEKVLVERPEKKFVNEFETDLKQDWEQNPLNLVHDKVFSGARANRIEGQGYSATLTIPLSRLFSDSVALIEITTHLAAFMPDSATGVLVISIVGPGQENLFWDGFPLRQGQANANEWGRVGFMRRLMKVYPPDAFLKIYVWNNGSTPLFIDNFEIRLLPVVHM